MEYWSHVQHSMTPILQQITLFVAGCVACAGLFGATPAFARGDVQISIQPSSIAAGEKTAIRFTIRGISDPPVPTLPDLPDFRVSQPKVSQSTSVVNKRVIHSSVVYDYYLQSTKEGTFTIGPIEYNAKGETYTLPAVTLNVGPGLADTLQDRLFATLTLPKEEVYVQESTEIILSVYSHTLSLSDDFRLANLPSSGLSFQPFRDLQTERVNVNGKPYTVRRFRAHLRGLTAGTFNIAPSLTVPVQIQRDNQRRSNQRSLFDAMFRGMTVQTQAVDIQPDPVTITILPLPSQDRPADFSGAVGDFQFAVKAQPMELDVGDPITLTMEVTGRGNVDAVSAPALNLGAEFKLYDAKLITKQVNDSQTHGRKTFEQVVIPRSAAVNEIPTITFSYFHPDSAEYRTLEQGPFGLTIHENTNAVARVIQAAPSAEDGQEVEIIEEDIVYLKRDAGRWLPADRPAWFRRPAVLGAQAIPPLLALILYAVARRKNAIAQDVARSRRMRAPRQATEGIRRVQMALESGDNKAYFQAVWDSLAAYFADRLNLAPGEVSEDLVARRFEKAGMDPGDINRVQQIFELCEQARFGLGFSSEVTMTDSDRRSAEVILEKLDAAIKSCEKVKL